MQPRFLPHFAFHALFKRFPGFHKSRHQAHVVPFELVALHQQDFFIIVACDGHNDGGGEGRPHLVAAPGAAFGDVCVEVHGSTAASAKARSCVPMQ